MATSAKATSSSSTLVVEETPTFMPEFASEALRTLTTGFRTARKVAEGVERVVDGVDELATLALSQQKLRLEHELRKQQAALLPA